MPNQKHNEGANPLILGAFTVLASACAGDVVELGQDASLAEAPSATATSLCRTSTTLGDYQVVRRQADLDQLAGCEEIDGDLAISPFAHPDLRPLASLRVVRGSLILGSISWGRDVPPDLPDIHEQDAFVDAGWLDSLEGLESLELAGGLEINGISADSLEPLSSLRTVAGDFVLHGCSGLKDLSGLEGLTGLTRVSLHCDSLESLRGLSFPSRLEYLAINGAQLKDLANVSSMTSADYLEIQHTALDNLDALTSLGLVNRLAVSSNPELRNIDGIGGVSLVDFILIEDNARLEALPEMRLAEVHHLTVRDNAALRRWPAFPNTLGTFEGAAQNPNVSAAGLVAFSENAVQVSGNPLLESVVLPAGWQGAQYIAIEDNAALGRIDFSTARSVVQLSIANNASLSKVELGALDTVNELRVSGNPLLPLTGFDTVRSFDRQVSTEAAPGASPP